MLLLCSGRYLQKNSKEDPKKDNTKERAIELCENA